MNMINKTLISLYGFNGELYCFQQLILCQDDMIVVLRTLGENLSEKSDAVPPLPDLPSAKESQNSGASGSDSSKALQCLPLA